MRLPSLRIPSVAEEAEELLHTHRNDRASAKKLLELFHMITSL